MMFTLGIAALWTATKAVHGSDLRSWLCSNRIFERTAMAKHAWPDDRGDGPEPWLLFHRNVKPIDIYLSRLTLEAAGATMSFVFLALFFHFLGWLELAEDVLKIAAAWCLLAWFGSALAIFLGSLAEASETIENCGTRPPICCSRFPAPLSWSTHCHMQRSGSCCCYRWSMELNFFERDISGRR